jgi:Nitrous oxide-stimulated promoter
MADVPPTGSGPTTRKVQDGARHPRLARELKTIRAMARIFCRKHHGRASDGLCVDCEALLDYATRRLDRCVFGDDKPTCVNCTIHCYSEAMREDVRAVMRYAGPQMVWRHPVLAIAHLRDGRRPAPALPTPNRTPSAALAEARPGHDRDDP